MSTEQKEQAFKIFDSTGRWVVNIMLGFVCWYLSEINDEFKTMKSDVSALKQEIIRLNTEMNYLTNYDLKRK